MPFAYFAAYYLVHYFALPRIADYWEYSTYLIDLFFVVAAVTLFKNADREQDSAPKRELHKSFVTLGLVFFGLGAAVQLGLVTFKILNPFSDLSPILIFALLVVAPALEEGLFRIAFWRVLEAFRFRQGKSRLSSLQTLWITTVLFSFAHFEVLLGGQWNVFAPFILFQTFYTFVLGALLGQMRRTMPFRRVWLRLAILHFLFNLGFGVVQVVFNGFHPFPN